MNATLATRPQAPRTFEASAARGRLLQRLWLNTHTDSKQEDARGRRHVQRGNVFVEIDTLTDAEIAALIPAGC